MWKKSVEGLSDGLVEGTLKFGGKAMFVRNYSIARGSDRGLSIIGRRPVSVVVVVVVV